MAKTQTATQPSQQSKMGTPSSSKPVHELRLGRLKAAIRENSTESGVRYNVTVARLYKDETGSWKSTDSLRR